MRKSLQLVLVVVFVIGDGDFLLKEEIRVKFYRQAVDKIAATCKAFYTRHLFEIKTDIAEADFSTSARQRFRG